MADTDHNSSGSSSDSSKDNSKDKSSSNPVLITSTAAAAQGSAKEDTTLSASGQLTASDSNQGATLAWSVKDDAKGKYGSLAVDSISGAWTYTLNNNSTAVQGLADGASRKETFTVRVADSKGAKADQLVTITVSGTNDAPVINLNSLAIDGDSSSGKVKGTLLYTDADKGDKHTSGVTLKPLIASAGAPDLSASLNQALHTSINDEGENGKGAVKWDFALPSTAPKLAAGQAVLANYQLSIADNHGGNSAPQDLGLLILGTAGKPIVYSVAGSAGLTEQPGKTGSTAPDQASGVLSGKNLGLEDKGALVSALVMSSWSAGGPLPSAEAAVLASALSTSTVPTSRGGESDKTIAWQFSAPDKTFDFLAAGETLTLAYRVASAKGEDGKSQIIVLTVTGTNDGPVITSNAAAAAGTAQEDATLSAAGQLSASDVDHGATQAWSVQSPAAGAYGTLAVDGGTGKWTYALDNASAAVQALAAGESHDETFTVRVTDDQGATADQVVTVTVSGTNDAPVITSNAAAAAGGAQEDATLSAAGQLSASDVDHGATQAWSVQSAAAGAYGTLAVDGGTGTWTYALDNASAAVQALAAGESHDESFTVRVTDDQGATADQVVTVTVSGTNDAPVITSNAAAAAGAAQEDATLSASGQLSASDVDHGATQAWSVQGNATGAYGSLAVDGMNGKWTYTLDNSAAAVQAMAIGESHTENFTVRVTDDQGASADQAVIVTVTGTNDAPRITAEDLAGAVTAVPEVTAASGALVFTVEQFLGASSNNLATLRNYAATHAADYKVKTSVIDYTDDPNGFSGDIPGSSRWPAAEAQNVNGTGGINNNFFARITADFSVATADTYTFRTYNDDGVFLLIDNTLVIADTGYHPEAPFTGSIALTPGNHSIELFFYEGGGEASLEFSARSSTGAYGLVGETGGGLSGITQLTDSGTISFSDVDLTDMHLVSATGTPIGTPLGSLTAAKNSDTTGTGTGGQLTWTYTVADLAVAYLAAGQTKVESFTVTLDDQHGGLITKQIDVTITGTNDAPMLAAADVTGAVTEPVAPLGMLSDSGTIPFSDVDITDVHHVSVASVGSPYGSLAATIAADTTGSGTGGQLTWTYSIPASVVNILAQGEIKTESFNVTVDDENGGFATRKVDVTITGTNDTPVVSAQLSASANEGSGVLPLYMLAGASDPDQGAVIHATNLVWAEGGGGLPAGFTRSADSLYVDTSNPAYDSLAQGSSYVAHIGYEVTDQFGASVHQTAVVTINGVNDAPVAVNDNNSLTATTLSSQARSNFVNWVDWTSATGGGNGTPGTISGTINLGNGQTVGVTYSGEYFFAQTSSGANYYNLQNGTVPVGTYTSAAVANGPNGSSDIIALNQQTQKTLTFTQPVDNLFFAVVSLNGMSGGVNNGYLFDHDFQIASSGPGYFGTGAATKIALPDGRFELLSTYNNDGALREFHGVVQIDGTVQSLTWTSLAAETWNGFTIGTYGKSLTATATGSVLVNDSDPESDPITVTAVNGAAIVGNSITLNLTSGAEITVDKNGTYLYDENGAFGSLGQGQSKQDSFTYTVSDGHGGTSNAATVTITVNGVNDAPVSNNDTATTAEDTPVTISVLANDTDVDIGDNKSLQSATGAQHGSLSINGGNVVYTPAANYNGADSFTYTMRDAAGAQSTATVNVTVNPVTDSYTLSNLATNGSFEASTTGWTLTGDGVDVVSSTTLWQSGDGTYSVDLNAFHPGGVSQVLQTAPGMQYTVGFDLSKNPGGHADHATVQVTAAGSSQSYTYSAANSESNMMWSQQTFTFTATSTSTTLSFASTYPNDSVSGQPWEFYAEGPALDEVVVFANKTIDNFTKGAGGDVLQLHDLLTSVSAPHDGTAFSGGYLRFLQSGSNTLVQIDDNGGGDNYLTVATIVGQTLAQTDTPNYVL